MRRKQVAEGRSELRKQQNLYHRSVPLEASNTMTTITTAVCLLLCYVHQKKIYLSNHYRSVRNDRAQLTRAVTESHDEVNISIDH